MLHIIGRISNHAILECVWINSFSSSGRETMLNYQGYKNALTANYGNDWFLFRAEESSNVAKRIARGDAWKAVWKGKKITKISFEKTKVMKTGWIEVNLPLGPIYDYSKVEMVHKKSMFGKLKPGMLLELKNGKILLVGDINKNSGLCDDCHYGEETIVKRYKQLTIKDLT
jgi:hypothetical protein